MIWNPWLGSAIMIGIYAHVVRNRNPIGWALFALLGGLFPFLILVMSPARSRTRSWPDGDITRVNAVSQSAYNAVKAAVE